MKTILLLLTLSGLSAQLLNAQTITNASFEDWTESGKEPPFDWKEPAGWKSSNSMTEWTSAGITRSDDEKSGTYAVKIRSVMINNGWYCVLCNGDPQLIPNFSAPDINIITGGEPMPDAGVLPKAFRGNYKFKTGTAGDSAYAIVILKKYNSSQNKYDTVAIGQKALAPAASYTTFEIPIIYKNTTVQADSFVIAFYSTKPMSPAKPDDFTKTGELVVDDISFSQTVSVNMMDFPVTAMQLYPNPAKEYFTLELTDYNMAGSQISIYSITGKPILSVIIGDDAGKQFRVSTKHFSPGVYMVKLDDATAGKTFLSKLIVY